MRRERKKRNTGKPIKDRKERGEEIEIGRGKTDGGER